jgi:phosphoglycerate dehydrogenase-like enzyme
MPSAALLTVHVHDLDEPQFQEPFHARLSEWNASPERPIELVPRDAPYEVLVAGVATRELLEVGPRTLIIPWSGVPRSVAALCREFPNLAVHNLHHNAAPVAEHAIGLLLAAARRLVPADRGLRQGDWRLRFETSDAPLISGRRALILGAGAIGRRIARACLGLGMSPTLLASRAREAVLGPDDLDEALGRADVLFVTLPLTPATDGLIDARRLALLPAGGLVVNVGRGPIINEAALFDALASKRLAGAGLDVWYSYPKGEPARAATPPSTFPFHTLDHVVLSPHRAGHGTQTERLCAEALFAALARAARGEPIGNDVDPARGY